MTQNNVPHDFLTLGDLKSFNESVNNNVFNDGDDSHVDVPYDAKKYTSFIVRPDELDENFAYQLSDIIDKKAQLDTEDVSTTSLKSPDTIDLLLASEYVAYVMDGNVPVAVATIKDPNIENYKGIIPADFYALKSAFDLDGRYQQEFFTVADEHKDSGISGELRRLLEEKYPDMFTVISVNDIDSIEGLAKNGYTMVSEFDTEWDLTPVQLWIN